VTYSSPSKPAWDKRAWFLGLFLGNFAGLLLFCGSYSTSRRFLESAFPYSAFGYYTGDLLVVLGAVSGALVSPTVLTCAAKRSYALWGLLPLVLLILWVVAGHTASHTVSSVFDPFWALPSVTLLCWGIASYPVSLFRFLRQHRQRPIAYAPRLISKKPLSWRVRIFSPLVPLFALVILGWYNLKHPIHFTAEMQANWPLGKEARVPLIKRGHGLYVKVWLNDKEELCQLDTGATNVDWPRGLHVEGELTSWSGQSCDVLGECIATRTIVLPHIRIGGHEVTNLPTEMSDDAARLFAPPQRPDADDTPLLGNSAFVMTVLTVDYKNAGMIIRPPGYDFTKQPRKAGDRVIQMGWTTSSSDESWESVFYGVPSICMSLAGASFWCALDTGCGGSDLDLTSNFVEHHPSIRQAKRDLIPLNATNSSAQVERLHDLAVTITCLAPPHVKPISMTLDGSVTPTQEGDDEEGEGVIGLALMKRYRITIDYGRRRVLLEPYAQAASGRKQEKTLPKAKQ